uniref:NADH-ubiquinone oxidoreductase chain 6 n=1 Tax=Perlomyia isobeae TaxID=2778728 RepID=A0A7L8ZUE3_9NEOP|nr:NADH dehydrogenase subunit 6 [Perlomyia isobeae]QOI73908.1 NADH dehydrogenase subunit 6 [Perlomyia isobeae]
MLLTANVLISMIFTQMKHPLAMGLLLLTQTLVVCLLTGTLTQSFWFSYILFLIFIGGLLVLFIYVTSLASNEMFTISTKPMIWTSLAFTTMFLTYFIIDPSMFMTTITSADMFSSYKSTPSLVMSSSLTKLYVQPTGVLTSMLILYLFLTLIAVVKITSIFQGPLRQKN